MASARTPSSFFWRAMAGRPLRAMTCDFRDGLALALANTETVAFFKLLRFFFDH
jgi:hypothetical protein